MYQRAGQTRVGLESAWCQLGEAFVSAAVGITLSVRDTEDSAPGKEPQVRAQAEQKSAMES